jgi:hypothetical protein
MDRKLSIILLIVFFDIFVSIPFIFSNLYIWDFLKGKLTANTWGPLAILIEQQHISGGEAVTIGTFVPIPNYPFILFWIALAGNFVLLVLALKNISMKQTAD